MNQKNFHLTADDGKEFYCYQWSKSHPRAIVQIVHGVAEHAGRYSHFAEALLGHGFAVFAEDHRGHGKTAGSAPGDMGPANALERVCGDVVQLSKYARAEFPGLPLVLFGHSMGSLISQLIIPRHGKLYDAVILSGSPSVDVLTQAKPVIDEAVAGYGRDAPAEALQMAMFGAFLEGIDDPRTPFDWLSRDPVEVDKYMADPLCGFALTLGSFQDLAEMAPQTADPKSLESIPALLPVLIFSGAEDPAHGNGAAIEQLYSGYKQAGLSRLSQRVYPDGRHEMLNELNREEVIGDIIAWIDTTLVESR